MEDRIAKSSPATVLLNLLAAICGIVLCGWVALECWCVSDSNEAHDYRLEVVVAAQRIPPAAKGKQVWIGEIVLDGKVASVADVGMEGVWRCEPRGEWRFVCEAPVNANSLRFRCASGSFRVLMHPWSGALDLYRDGVCIDSLVLTSADSGVRLVELGRRVDGWAVAILALLALGGLALVRPWMGGARLTSWLALLVAIVHAHTWIGLPLGLADDSRGYAVTTALQLQGLPSYFPPGYGAFLTLVGWTGPDVGLAATAWQHALVVVLAVLLHRHFRPWCGEACSFVGALVGSCAFPILVGSQAVISDSWAYVTLASCVLVGLQPGRRPSTGLLAGLLAGWAVLSRVIPLFVVGPLFVLHGLLPWARRSWRWTLVTLGAMFTVIAIPVANTGLRSGHWSLSTGVGRHLYNHFVYQQKLLDPTAPSTRLLAARVNGDLRDLPHWDVANSTADGGEREKLLLPVAIEAARTVGIVAHLRFCAWLTWRNLATSATGWMYNGDTTNGGTPFYSGGPLRGDRAAGDRLYARIAALNDVLWPILSWLFAAAIGAAVWVRHARGQWLAWTWTVWAYMFLSSAVEYEMPRYHVAVAPLIGMLAVAVVGVVVRRLVGAPALRP